MLHKYVSDYPSGVKAWRVASGPAQSTQGTRRSDDTWDMMTYDDTWWPRPWWHMMTHVITYDDTWWYIRYYDKCDHTLWYLMSHNHTWSHIMTQIERDDKWWRSVMLLSIPNSHNHAVVRHWHWPNRFKAQRAVMLLTLPLQESDSETETVCVAVWGMRRGGWKGEVNHSNNFLYIEIKYLLRY